MSTHTRLANDISAAYASPERLRELVLRGQAAPGEAPPPEPEVPADIASWLGRLQTLIGVPFGYLVADEAMLPPESIRFFRLDNAWIEALIDGAYSLGRNLTAEASASMNLDAAMSADLHAQSHRAAPRRRGRIVDGVAEDSPTDSPWTGFLMRSSLVHDYPGLGVNVYERGHTPEDQTIVLLPIRRLDRLGEKADTLFCLIEGEAYRVDVHEAPEVLHYGIDSYDAASGSGNPTATKIIHTFSVDPPPLHLSGDTASLDIGDTFRSTSPRVMKMTAVAAKVAAANNVSSVNAAEMGFEMTEGVGMVSFIDKDPA